MVRSYSLSNPQGQRQRYVIAVQKDAHSRGGSRFIHESLRDGDVVRISAPRNHFPLDESAPHSLFIAGGIGITPLWCMIQRLEELGRAWTLVYCSRTQPQAAFLAPLVALKKLGRDVRLNFDGEPGGRMADVAALVNEADPGTHLYCCGPTSLIAAFEQACASRLPEQVHVEYFSPKDAPATEGGVTVVLAKSGKEVFVEAGKTILDALLEQRVNLSYSCMEGTCGECVVRVISGTPDHRDTCLTAQERASNEKIAICVSGSASSRMVLDL